jgi:hypothetical protein
MNKAESDRIHQLCAQIAVEQDDASFLELLLELNRLLIAMEFRPANKTLDRAKPN